jgi:hypothetical protein
MDFFIPLRNRVKSIVAFTIVDEDDFIILNKYKWSKNDNGYVKGNINGQPWNLHRFIMINILNNNIDFKMKIDHIDGNKLNNSRENLRIVSDSENARNKIKQANTSSKYIGVSFDKSKNEWRTSISINNKKINARYDNEDHAGYQYNLWCKEYNLTTANLNNISDELLIDFKPHIKKEKVDNLPKNIQVHKKNRFLVRIKGKDICVCNTLEEAIIIKEKSLIEIEKEQPIKRNNNECIIELFNKKKEKVNETIVDENIYYKLMEYTWGISDRYIRNSKLGTLHRYIMNYTGDDLIDHINNNKMDNRKENLRIVTQQQNSQNRSLIKNKSSKYIGVCYHIVQKKMVCLY